MQTLPLAEVRTRLSALVDEVDRTAERVTITRKGVPVAVVVSVDDLAALEETLAWLDSPGAIRRAVEADEAVEAGDVVGRDEMAALMSARSPVAARERDSGERQGYELAFGSAARRALAERLPERVASAVWAFCDGPLRDNPYRVGKPLRPSLAASTPPGAARSASGTASMTTSIS
ncbi:MAG: type II toxin-antitoxin system prevent-host-death family antitoxin [Pseudonocardia sp.]